MKKGIQYYFAIDTYPKSPNYRKPMSVHRMRIDDTGDYPERWNGKQWVINNALISVCGIGGDTHYDETTEEEAKKFISTHSKKDNENMTLEEAMLRIDDALRYTITYEPHNYVESTGKAFEMLKARGFQPYDDKQCNYWGSTQYGYRGLNTTWVDKDGNKMEVQFHTPQSFQIKQAIHDDYVAYKNETDPAARMELRERMEGAWTNVTVPPNWQSLPGKIKP